MDVIQELPPIGPTLGVAAHQRQCPLCGGPNPHFDNTREIPEPQALRPPSVKSRDQTVLQRSHPPEYTQADVVTTPPRGRDAFEILDNPIIGGKLTVCVLCYGDYPEIAKKCLNGILESIPRHRLDLRVGANAVCDETLRYLRTLPATRLYVHTENACKYPVMREMFWDESCPLATRYLCWFDDDSYVADPNWAIRLGETIIENHKHSVRLFGMRYMHNLAGYKGLKHDARRWFTQAPWWRGIPMGSLASERPVADGAVIHFVAGGFWAIGVDAIRQGDIPDRRLKHNGGDITIGEQVRQAGFRATTFNKDKARIFSSGSERRGYHEPFPWVGK